MPEPVVEIPDRPAFRASEVCEIAQIPPYVLRSWEKEFPGLGTPSKPGGPRVYRRADVEQVVRIKHMLFAEGLTLAGARRKLEGEPKVEDEPLPDLPVAGEVREKVARVKQELRSLLDLLSSPPPAAVAASAEDVEASPEPETPAAVEPVVHLAEPEVPAAADAARHATEPELPLLDGVSGQVPEAPPPKRRRAHRRTAARPTDPT